MGGALKSVGNLVGSAVKNIVPAAVKAIAGPATQALTGIVGDLFTKGGSALNNLASRLPGPLAGLAQGALGAILPKLQDLATGGVEKLIGSLANSVTERFAPAAGNITVPGLDARLGTIAQQTAAATTNSTSSAATTPSTVSSTQTQTAANAANQTELPRFQTDQGGLPTPPKDWTNQAQVAEYQDKMQRYQMSMTSMQNFYQQLSNILKAQSDSVAGTIRNLR
ncbi:MAG: hypothetical protein ACO1OB_21750 [Archangium sp.]